MQSFSFSAFCTSNVRRFLAVGYVLLESTKMLSFVKMAAMLFFADGSKSKLFQIEGLQIGNQELQNDRIDSLILVQISPLK